MFHVKTNLSVGRAALLMDRAFWALFRRTVMSMGTHGALLVIGGRGRLVAARKMTGWK